MDRIAAVLAGAPVLDGVTLSPPQPESKEWWFDTLDRKFSDSNRQADLRKYLSYYENAQDLQFIIKAIIKGLKLTIEPLRFNWSRLVIDSLDAKLNVDGFRRPNAELGDDKLWKIFTDNSLDTVQQAVAVDSMIFSHCFMSIGTNPKGKGSSPVVRLESPLEMVADFDPVTKEVRAAFKRWKDTVLSKEYATLYLPEATYYYEYVIQSDGFVVGWKETDSSPHDLGVVPIVPFVNRWTPRNPEGESELVDIIPIVDAVCKLATDLMQAAESHAVPRRVLAGVQEKDFQDPSGNPVDVLTKTFAPIMALSSSEAKVFEFSPSDLKNFETAINILAKQLAAITGLPVTALGFSTDNPASANSIGMQNTKHDKNVERKMSQLGANWRQVMQVCELFMNGKEKEDTSQLEVSWSDPSTPTQAQRADAVTKLYSAGIVPLQQTWIDLGYSEVAMQRMAKFREDDLKAAIDNAGGFFQEPQGGNVNGDPGITQSGQTPQGKQGTGNTPSTSEAQ